MGGSGNVISFERKKETIDFVIEQINAKTALIDSIQNGYQALLIAPIVQAEFELMQYTYRRFNDHTRLEEPVEQYLQAITKIALQYGNIFYPPEGPIIL